MAASAAVQPGSGNRIRRTGSLIVRALVLLVIAFGAGLGVGMLLSDGSPAEPSERGGAGPDLPVLPVRVSTEPLVSQPFFTAPSPPGPPTPEPPVIYIVQEGDSLSAIAARLNVGLQALIDENRLSPPYDLAIGQALFVPKR